MLSITKKFKFDASHSLPNYDGKCKALHGHTFFLHIEIKGEIDSNTGMIIDFATVKKIIEYEIIRHLDHNHLNNILENPTAENLIIWIKDKLLYTVFGELISRIRLYETPDSYAEWKKE